MKQNRKPLFAAILFSAIGALGCGLLRTRQALSGIDITTLLFYYEQLKTELRVQRVSGLLDMAASYSVVYETAVASLLVAALAFCLFLLLWLPHVLSRVKFPSLWKRIKPTWLKLVSIGILLASLVSIVCTVHLPRYLYLQRQDSPIYAENYVDPAAAHIQFPEQKRNLIHIYLESMETTYQDTASGGSWPTNLIPELTQLAEENISFSNLVSLTGTSYTSGALVAQTAGFPINRSVSMNELDGEFLPYACTLNNILADEGYRQIFMCGSDGNFGARTLYYTSHGNTEVWDYATAIAQGVIPADYMTQFPGWGLRDHVLFDWAKSAVTELAAGDQPFYFSLLTVDTHFYDGYLCDYCGSEHATQYENVIRCSDRLAAEFVRWIQAQPFYENTTIVITGDHPTMDLTFIAQNTQEMTQRGIYACVINPYGGITPENSAVREASTFDIFPTTLAAMGARWDGDQLAFGVNLFRDTPTLVEKLGREPFDIQLQMPADDYLARFYHR